MFSFLGDYIPLKFLHNFNNAKLKTKLILGKCESNLE